VIILVLGYEYCVIIVQFLRVYGRSIVWLVYYDYVMIVLLLRD